MKLMSAADLDLAALLRAGDRIVVGQAAAEPLTLTRRLAAEPRLPPDCRVFLGPVYSDTFTAPIPPSLSFEGYGAIGRAADIARAGRLDVLPMHYSALSRSFADGSLGADCVMIQLGVATDGESLTLGLCNGYEVEAARHARLVIAEINPDLPACRGAEWPDDIQIHFKVAATWTPLDVEAPMAGETELAITDHVAALVPDRAALQFGVGAIPQSVAGRLRGHRDLGLHSGALFDAVVDLVECGAVTNAAKEHHAGVSVAGMLIGSRRLSGFAHDNPAFRLCPPLVTHGHASIAALSRFCAINSAIEVDLTGQVNAETLGGRYVGAVGGQVDFVRGANASPGGRAIVALPSTARGGTVSRIVPQATTVTCGRSDADAIVTEWGVADLRGCTISQRVEKMIAIAAPQFREELARSWRDRWRTAHE